MSRDAYQQLVSRFAEGRVLCNCREAYYTACGNGINSQGQHVTDMLVCRYGCEANQLFTKYEIAEKLITIHPEVLQ